jgi:hypothetical protein
MAWKYAMLPASCQSQGVAAFESKDEQTYARAIDEYRRDAIRKLEALRDTHSANTILPVASVAEKPQSVN